VTRACEQLPPVPEPPKPLPAEGVEFTWEANGAILVAGAPREGVLFEATQAPGARFEWDFDYQPERGFRPDPATGQAVRHTFSAALTQNTGAPELTRPRAAGPRPCACA